VTSVTTDAGPESARPLAELTLAELWQLFPITLREYDPRYPTWFAEESARVAALFPGFVFRLSHIGSTAVPGLVSKPIVDMLLEITPDCPSHDVVAKLAAAGWNLMARRDEPLRLDLNKGYTPAGFAERVFHLHIVRPGDHNELYFRDFLRQHPEACVAYVELKRRLAAQYRHDRDAYTAAKAVFIQQATLQARAEFPGRHSRDGDFRAHQKL